jgi:paraquat-inducible protein A
VLFCGVLAPVAVLTLLVFILGTDDRKAWQPLNRRLRGLAEFIEYWAMPEVQVLGVLVAFLKLGSIVTVTVGPGLWCYAAASFCMLAAWRRFNLHPTVNATRVEEVVP